MMKLNAWFFITSMCMSISLYGAVSEYSNVGTEHEDVFERCEGEDCPQKTPEKTYTDIAKDKEASRKNGTFVEDIDIDFEAVEDVNI